jgi:hypothetical protein
MTTEQLAALKETVRGTTPGSRKVVVTKGSVSLYAPDENCRIYRTELDPECLKQTHDRQVADAWFHAKFNPTTCLELLEEVERLTAEIEFWQNENVKSHELGATMAGLLTDAQQEELNRLRRDMQSSSLGDRPSSISADKLRRLIHLESQAKGQS